MLKNIAILFLPFLMIGSCNEKSDKLFTLMDEGSTGVDFRNMLLESEEFNVLNYSYFYNGGGVAIGDINNDGLQDLLFTGNMVKNRLFLNKGDFKFEDITRKSGIANMEGWCTGATMADLNADGKMDIYISRSADVDPQRRKNLLFINNGDLTFVEKADEYGLGETGYSTQSSFFDYDKDGDLDCFIINHSVQKYSAGAQNNPELRKQRDPAYANKLYRNDNGHFNDVSVEAGITSNVFTFGLGVAVSDLNNDGWPDVYVSNDFNEPDYFFINNRNGTFTDSLPAMMDQVSLYSMGSDAADYNNDGLVDLVTLDMMPESNYTQKMHAGPENFDKFQALFNKGFYFEYSRNMLQRNNGDGTFSEVAQLAGVSNTDWSWAALFSDFDNDGNKDLFVSNGYVKDYTEMDFLKYSVDRAVRTTPDESENAVPDYIKKMPTLEIPNYIFRNNGDETFTKKTSEWGLEKPGVSAGAAYADLDNDGDLDLVVNNTNDFAGIYRNNNEQIVKNNFLRIQLEGSPSNRNGFGTKVKLYSNNKIYYQEQYPVRGFQSSSDPVLNFGIGKDSIIDSILIIWPNDQYQKFRNVKANQALTAKMGDASARWYYDTAANSTNALLQQSEVSAAQHRENEFNDFTVQSLLPNYLSRSGPCIEVADLNSDGLEDFFIGGAKGAQSQIFIQSASGTFNIKTQAAFAKDVISEDVAATLFDADSDGDQDLYIATGGYEFDENDPALQDRLYINDGFGNFSIRDNALPAMLISNSCVKAADIDADGDQDLFVGGRVVPGKYPVSPDSKILLNDGKGKFTDGTASIAASLQKIGMVTDAAWADLNGDKAPDLVIVGEWMPIKIYINQKGKLVDQSPAYLHFGSTGWWNRLHATDMDEDGDIDLVVGNCGLNNQFHANEKEPMDLYYKDFDNNGSIDPILCYYIDGVSYPAASRDDLTEQLPGLKKKYLTYKDYANATINDLFTKDQLKDAGVLKAEMMQTVYLENTGKGFEVRQLPIEAQYAPVHAISASDVNHDGKKDLIVAGNNTWTRIKFGRYIANHGQLFLNDGKNNFTYVPQPESGLNIRDNVRSLKKIAIGKNVSFICGINNSSVKIIKVK